MEARYTPKTHPGWPVRTAGGDLDGEALRVIGAAGWNHLLRAGFAALLPLECPGVAPPWRLMCAKERLGRLRVSHCQVHPVLRGNRCHPERRQRDDVRLLRPPRPDAQTKLDTPGV